ncbi:S41 family peptidase [Clostridiaceae bacterium M8S5]|nr:S41 family peptidase [Clostridiaceae bacterium M8S5]
MIPKRKAIVIAVLLVVITSVSTIFVTNLIEYNFLESVRISKTEYDKIKDIYKNHTKLFQLEEYIKENFLEDIKDTKLFDGQLKGMFEALDDPYSEYMTPKEFKSYMDLAKGSYEGIGIYIAPGKDNLITVISPIEDTPAEKAGIKPGDKIIKINGKEYLAEDLDDAVKIMKGKPNTSVTITIMRKDKNNKTITKDISIKRQIIRVEKVKSKLINKEIGYLRLRHFDEYAYDEFMSHLKNLKSKNIKGLVIDLRSNPGGYLDECVDIADELIGKSLIVYTETRKGKRKEEYSDANKLQIPYVLLVNQGSASASEILAGAVQDTKSGVIIGTKTYGKGIVQLVNPLDDGSGFKITVSKYYTPNGRSIHGIGIIPDIKVEMSSDIKIGVDNINADVQLKKAVSVLKQKIK